MAQRPNSSLDYVAGLCRRNAVHVVRLAWTTHPHIGFDRAGVRWLDRYIQDNRVALSEELSSEFVQFMGCFYGECLMQEFDGRWEHSGGVLGVRMDRLGFTYPFAAIEKQVAGGHADSVATAFFTAVEYLADAAA